MTSTYNEHRDSARLKLQQDKVRALMSDGNFRTLEEISLMTGAPPASASARLRQLRKEGYEVQREYVRRGLFKYRVVPKPDYPAVTAQQNAGDPKIYICRWNNFDDMIAGKAPDFTETR
jgi:hypothetical protein